MTDDRLNYLLSVIPERSFLLLEDIDALFTEQRQMHASYQSRLTFSGLLNALDGVGSSEERIVFMTTNHYDKLDAALLRPGRVDMSQYIGFATQEQALRMFLQFYPGFHAEAKRFSSQIIEHQISPAKIQGHFIRYKHHPPAALEHIAEIYT
jgi:mitochondrial chaperone BCS1